MRSYRQIVLGLDGTATNSFAQIVAHLSSPLYRNGYALTLSSAATSVLGVVYWITAAHVYSAEDIGVNSAVISAMMFLAGISHLNLMSALMRFIPGAGRATGRFVRRSYLISITLAAVVSFIFIRGLGLWMPSLGFLGSQPLFTPLFMLATMAWCIFVLQDSVLTALRQATWVPIENTAFALAKIALLIAAAGVLPRYGIFASWTIALAFTLLPTNTLIFRYLIPRHVRAARQREAPLVPRQIVRYVAADYVGSLFWLSSTTLTPLLVTQLAGAAANGYFFLAWQIGYSLYLVSPNMGSSLIVEAANDPEKLGVYSYRVLLQTARIIVPAAVVVALLAPYGLRLFGNSYASEATTLLRLLALSAIPNIVTSLYICVARVQRRMRSVVVVLASLCILVLSLSALQLRLFGITGVGLAWLESQTIVAAVLFATRFRPLWASSATAEAPDGRAGPVDPSADMALGTASGHTSGTGRDPGPTRTRATASSRWAALSHRYQPRLLRQLYAVANGLHLLPLLHLALHGRGYRRRAAASALIRRLLPEVTPLPDMAPPATWSVRRIAPSVTETTVAAVGPRGYPCVAVVKLPQTEIAVLGLRRQQRALAALHADQRLGEWRSLLPAPLTCGEIDGQAYVVERMLPGREARRVLRNPEARARMQAAAAAAIAQLHRRTAALVPVDAPLLESWVDEPLSAVRRLTATLPAAAAHDKALDRLAVELYDALAGRTLSLSTVHGDFTPGNILVTPDGARVTGIIDWDRTVPDGIPLLDMLLLLLSVRAHVQRRDVGEVVCGLLGGAGWAPHEQALAHAARAALPGDVVDLRASVLLCWLHHVAGNLTQFDRYAGHRLWVSRNIETVLQCL